MQRGYFRNTLLTSIEIQLRKCSTGYISECHYCILQYPTFVFLKRAHDDVSVALVRPFLFSLENEILTAVRKLEFIQCCQLFTHLTRHIWQHCNPWNKFLSKTYIRGTTDAGEVDGVFDGVLSTSLYCGCCWYVAVPLFLLLLPFVSELAKRLW